MNRLKEILDEIREEYAIEVTDLDRSGRPIECFRIPPHIKRLLSRLYSNDPDQFNHDLYDLGYGIDDEESDEDTIYIYIDMTEGCQSIYIDFPAKYE